MIAESDKRDRLRRRVEAGIVHAGLRLHCDVQLLLETFGVPREVRNQIRDYLKLVVADLDDLKGWVAELCDIDDPRRGIARRYPNPEGP